MKCKGSVTYALASFCFVSHAYFHFVACVQGWFGYNCRKECGYCKDNVTCNFKDGTCRNGCEPGYTTDTCEASMSSCTDLELHGGIPLNMKQEGQDGPGSLPWFFEIALANFFCRFQRRIYKNFLMSVQCKKPPFTNTMFIDRSKVQEQF